MKKFNFFLLAICFTGIFLAVSCENREPDSQISGLTFTPCQQNKLKAKSNSPSDGVNVIFTGNGVQITYNNFAVTCDFNTVDVTYTFVNGFLNITQQGSPSVADCVCYSDVSYTINGISQSDVNVIFINGEQVYCHGNNEPHCSTWEWMKNYPFPLFTPPPGEEVDITLTFDSLQGMVYVSTNPTLCNQRIGAHHYLFCDGEQYVFSGDTIYSPPHPLYLSPDSVIMVISPMYLISSTRYVCDTIDVIYFGGVPGLPGYIRNYKFRKTH